MDKRRIAAYAIRVCDDYREAGNEVNLTALEEDTMAEFNLSEYEWEEWDMSYYIFKALERAHLLD